MKYLAIFAHPDDESYGPAGTLAKLVSEQNRISLLTFTKGEGGKLGICATLDKGQIAEMRSQELKKAVSVLGFEKHTLLDYPDKKLTELPDKTGKEIIKDHIKKYKPNAIITFHPNGISGHPDHKSVTKWCELALQEIEDKPVLLHYGLSIDQKRLFTQRELFAIPDDEILFKIDVEDYVSEKIAAIQCHESQLDLWQQFNSLPIPFNEFSRFEYFSLGGYANRHKLQIKNELFFSFEEKLIKHLI